MKKGYDRGRTCTKCGEWKEWDKFPRNKNKKYGYNSCCKFCMNKLRGCVSWRERFQITEEGRICYICQNWKTWNNFYKRKGGINGHRSACKQCEKLTAILFVKNHLDEANFARRCWRATEGGKEKMKIQRKRWRIKNIDIKFKINHNISSRIREALRDKKAGESWETLVGYTLGDLMTHLEKQFTNKISWDTYGKYGWHIDHIKPITAFNFSSIEDKEFKKCWALKNLQPLWWKDNIQKRNKLNWSADVC